MSDRSQAPGWWRASDGRWYPPEASASPTLSANAVLQGAQPWWGNPGVVVLMLFCCFPVGLALMWSGTRWTNRTKATMTPVVLSLFALGMIVDALSTSQDQAPVADQSPTTSEARPTTTERVTATTRATTTTTVATTLTTVATTTTEAPTTTTAPPAPAPLPPPPPAAPSSSTVPSRGGGGVYYARCSDAKAAGAAPLRRGDPGYRPELDRDGDGIACET